MFLERALKIRAPVSSLAREVLLGVLEFVLIERELGFGKLELRGRGVTGFGRLGQLSDLFLIRGDPRLHLIDLIRELLQRTGGRRSGRGRFAKGGRKGLIKFAVGQAQRLARELVSPVKYAAIKQAASSAARTIANSLLSCLVECFVGSIGRTQRLLSEDNVRTLLVSGWLKT